MFLIFISVEIIKLWIDLTKSVCATNNRDPRWLPVRFLLSDIDIKWRGNFTLYPYIYPYTSTFYKKVPFYPYIFLTNLLFYFKIFFKFYFAYRKSLQKSSGNIIQIFFKLFLCVPEDFVKVFQYTKIYYRNSFVKSFGIQKKLKKYLKNE